MTSRLAIEQEIPFLGLVPTRRVAPRSITESETTLPERANASEHEQSESTHDVEIEQLLGSVLSVSDDRLTVRLRGSDMELELPSQLYTGPPASFGTPVAFKILRRRDGTRYQRLVYDPRTGSAEALEMAQDLLAAI